MTDPRVDEILDIVSKETAVPRERLALDARMDALGIPSLDLVQAIFALETHFNIELPVADNQDGAEFTTVGDLVAHVVATIDLSRGATQAAAGSAMPSA